MATSVAARVLGIEKSSGSLEVGKDADILVLGLTKPNMQPCFGPLFRGCVQRRSPERQAPLYQRIVGGTRPPLGLCRRETASPQVPAGSNGFYAEAQRLSQVKE